MDNRCIYTGNSRSKSLDPRKKILLGASIAPSLIELSQGGRSMKFWTSALLIMCLACLPDAFAQDTTRTGFAIVTVLSGNVAALVATENLINTNAGTQQAVVAPSILITQASILVPLGP